MELSVFTRNLQNHKDHGKAKVHGIEAGSALILTPGIHTYKITRFVRWVHHTPGLRPSFGHEQDLARAGKPKLFVSMRV